MGRTARIRLNRLAGNWPGRFGGALKKSIRFNRRKFASSRVHWPHELIREGHSQTASAAN